MRVSSVSRGDWLLVVSPSRLETRKTWVSTAMVGWSNITEVMTLAVLRPTPGSFIRSVVLSGTWELKSETSMCAIPCRCFALLFG